MKKQLTLLLAMLMVAAALAGMRQTGAGPAPRAPPGRPEPALRPLRPPPPLRAKSRSRSASGFNRKPINR
jgi:hypothetical protein